MDGIAWRWRDCLILGVEGVKKRLISGRCYDLLLEDVI